MTQQDAGSQGEQGEAGEKAEQGGQGDQTNRAEKAADAKRPRRFSQSQYEMLLRCSEAKDMTEWNEWRAANPDEEILLEGAKLYKAHLKGGKLNKAHLKGADLKGAKLFGADLVEADLSNAHLEKGSLELAQMRRAILHKAHLRGANLFNAHLEKANLIEAHLEGADLGGAHLERAELEKTRLEGAKLFQAHLEGAELWNAHLERADLGSAHLEGAELLGTFLKGTKFRYSIVDGETLISHCRVHEETNFIGVGLGHCRIDPGLKQLLEYNVRRERWEEFYRTHRKWRWRWLFTPFLRWFWWTSDYGLSTKRILGTFFVAALAFAILYVGVGLYCHHVGDANGGLVANLFDGFGKGQPVNRSLIALRALYFSVVTMTTLGFGDMHANAKGSTACYVWGHIALMAQVLLGYVLLGAIITRMAILFQAGGPAGTFANKPAPKEKQMATEKPEGETEKKESG